MRKLTRMLVQRLHSLSRASKKSIMVAMDVVLISFSLWLALSLRLGVWYTDFKSNFFLFLAVPFFTVPILARLGLYRAVMRYVGRTAIQQVFTGVVISAAIVLGLTLVNWPNGLPRSVFVIYAFIAFTLLGATRLFARAIFGGRVEWRGQPVAVYGAGASGRQLVGMLRAGHEYRPILYIDDNAQLVNREVEGLPVYNPNDPELEQRLTRLGVVAVFLAMPSVSRSVKRKILQKLEGMPFRVCTVPSLDEIVSGTAQINQIREIAVADLLGRDPVPPNENLMARCISSYSVLVTGAGGSIGSELCRQVIANGASKLVLLENTEYALFKMDDEIRMSKQHSGNRTEIVPVLGSVCDADLMDRLMREHRVETVYHAAAYKHVPLVEHNPVAGIINNVFGTRVVAEAARSNGVKHFVFISTDKAVRPTNVMGASKRLGELMLQAFSVQPGETTFSIVRFGNVLDSSGSVVPRFRQQITGGGPVTVTHPEITRYFMTIPEAVQLVIQAGAMARGGDVFVLDMGEAVRIYDLARQMIHLSGLEVQDDRNPDGDIEIVFTGLRPGEKLCEELLIGNNSSGTMHPKILRAEEEMMEPAELEPLLASLESAIAHHQIAVIRKLLLDAVKGYQPAPEPVEEGDAAAKPKFEPAKVVELTTTGERKAVSGR